jgi:hypothetical protein
MFINASLVIAATYFCGHWLAGVCTAALILIWRLLPRTQGPPVLALAMTAQWVQVTVGVFYTGLTGRPLQATERSDYEPMVFIGLGCVLVMTVGLWAGSRFLSRRMARIEVAPTEIASLKVLVVVYIAGVFVTGLLQQIAWMYPTLTQAILAFSFARLAVVYLLLRRLTHPQLRWQPIFALLTFEIVLGFTGFFSGFKEPLLLSGLAMLEGFNRRRLNHWLTAAVLTIVLGLTTVMWMGVRTEFRHDFDDEAFAASRSLRLQRMQALMTDWIRNSRTRIQDDIDLLIDRGWAIYYPALAVERVPAVLPHTHGQLITDAVTHLLTPRVLFPEKPELPSDSEMVRKYSGMFVAGPEQQTSIAFGYAAESYVDFGLPLMFVPVLVFGVLMGIAYEWLLRAIAHRELAISLVTCIFWLNLYLFERSWARMLGLTLTMLVYVGAVSWLIDRWLMIGVEERLELNTDKVDLAVDVSY